MWIGCRLMWYALLDNILAGLTGYSRCVGTASGCHADWRRLWKFIICTVHTHFNDRVARRKNELETMWRFDWKAICNWKLKRTNNGHFYYIVLYTFWFIFRSFAYVFLVLFYTHAAFSMFNILFSFFFVDISISCFSRLNTYSNERPNRIENINEKNKHTMKRTEERKNDQQWITR